MTYAGDGAEDESLSMEARYDAAAQRVGVLADIINDLGCRMCIYNHGGWGGEPDTMRAIAERLQDKNVGIIYNFHHGHEHLDQFPRGFNQLVPYLASVNLNGMNKNGPKILPFGSGEDDQSIIDMIEASGYDGPIGILDHRMDVDARQSLSENLSGLEDLLSQRV